MIQYSRLSHVNIVVDDMAKAIEFYSKTLQAKPFLEFPRFRNSGFARSAGFLDDPESVCVSICFMKLASTDEFSLELMEYHSPAGATDIYYKKTNDQGGPRHIALGVENIDEAFEHVKKQPGVRLINESPEYRPFTIDSIGDNEFLFFDEALNNDVHARLSVQDTVGRIRYFYFLDPYGVQWEFEQNQPHRTLE